MPKAESTFRPIDNSEAPMHGRPAILMSGFPSDEQATVRQSLASWGIPEVPLIVIAPDTLPLTLAEAAALPDGTNASLTPELPRAIIMSGLTGRQLNGLMDGYRQSGLTRPLWASVTPTSATWTVKYLLVELLKEREAMRQAMLAKNNTQPDNSPSDPS